MIETAAAVLAVAYLILAIKQRRGCWLASFLSACLYVQVFFVARLYMDSALNVFYAAMAAYGFWLWRRGPGGLRVIRWSWPRHAACLAGVVGAAVISSYFLRRFTPAASPFVDSLVTWASVFATFLVARKVYENWHWWFAIDAVSLCLYYSRGLYLTTLLFAAYLVMIVVGMREWRRDALPPRDVVQTA